MNHFKHIKTCKGMELLKIAFFLALFMMHDTSVAQVKLDSLISNANVKVYEDPITAIKIGKEYLEKATVAKTKINALMLISNGYLSKRDYEKSLAYSKKTKSLFNEIIDPKVKISILNNIGMQYQQLLIYDKAIENLDEALLLAEETISPDSIPSYLGVNYAIRGLIYREQMSCEIALNYFNKSIVEFKKEFEKNNSMIENLSIIEYNKGNCELQISQIDSARISFNKSIKYAQINGVNNSLYAYAKKGLSEVSTVEGNYKQAIIELTEALKASDSVGDLVLNRGIYKNLSDNYLAINNRNDYQLYLGKYSNTKKLIRKKERGTINSSITNLIDESKLQTKNKKKELQNIQIILLILVVSTFLLLTYGVTKSRKKYKNALKNLESFKQ